MFCFFRTIVFFNTCIMGSCSMAYLLQKYHLWFLQDTDVDFFFLSPTDFCDVAVWKHQEAVVAETLCTLNDRM